MEGAVVSFRVVDSPAVISEHMTVREGVCFAPTMKGEQVGERSRSKAVGRVGKSKNTKRLEIHKQHEREKCALFSCINHKTVVSERKFNSCSSHRHMCVNF